MMKSVPDLPHSEASPISRALRRMALRMSLFSLVALTTAGLALASFGVPGIVSQANAQEAEPYRIDLRLFGDNVIEEYDGCRLALWQADKDPARDAYAYVFFAPYNDGEELPGWMKVGDTVYNLMRRDTMSQTGQQLEAMRLYRSSKNTFTMLMEIEAQHVVGDSIEIDKARLTITQSEHFPFVISVKGHVACPLVDQPEDMGPSAAPSTDALPTGTEDAITLGPAEVFDTLDAVPQSVMAAVKRDALDCNPAMTTGYGASYMVSDDMRLWEVPCNLYARTGTSVYVAALTDGSGHAITIPFPPVPNHGEQTGSYEIRAPELDPETGIVLSSFYDGNGTCGSFSAYQLRAMEGEALGFFLIEYREKPICDGVETEAQDFPLIYSEQ